MRFLLLGDHPDGVALAETLARNTHHEFAAFAGPSHTATRFAQQGFAVRAFQDPEDALALPEIDVAIVADEIEFRPAMLRRALQSEKHVLCVHPADLSPDIAYEAMMIQQDTSKQLLPLLPEHVAPGIVWLREQLKLGRLGPLQSVEIEQCFKVRGVIPNSKATMTAAWEASPLQTVWDALRQLGGEVQDLSALASSVDEELRPTDQITLTGRFFHGELFQVLLLPLQEGETSVKVTLRYANGQAVLSGSNGWFGPCQGIVISNSQEEPPINLPALTRTESLKVISMAILENQPPPLTWTDGTRCLELFDAARRSVKRRRVVPMDYEALSESGNFKSIMAASGCLTLIVVMVLFFLTPTLPWAKYLIAPILLAFLALQSLLWLTREDTEPKPQTEPKVEKNTPPPE